MVDYAGSILRGDLPEETAASEVRGSLGGTMFGISHSHIHTILQFYLVTVGCPSWLNANCLSW